MRTINIGAQGFDELREHGDFYIDKTSFIKEWWESRSTVTLITRPRRFGKTLNMRMLECFFSNRYANRGDLFEGLDIWKYKEYRELQGTWPAIFLSFADIKESTYPQARESVIGAIQNLFQSYLDRWQTEGDTEEEKKRYQFMNISAETSDADIARTLQRLTGYLYHRYGKKVLIFLDEYDTPLQEAFINGFWNEMSAFIRSLFNSTFKTNPMMERAVLTGITRVSKESIFSDFNNPNVVTATSRQYARSFGFTKQEVQDALDEFGLGDRLSDVKKWYDGFTFGDVSEIYNPWSILNFLNEREFSPYWANSSSNGLIGYELRVSDNSIKHQMEQLLNGGSVRTIIDEQIIFSQLGENSEAIWSLFLASGYLRIGQREFDGRRYIYTLFLTNLEVEMMFEDLIAGWFQTRDSYSEFTRALLRGDEEQVNYYLNDILLNSASSFDTRKKVVPGHEPESFYHGLVLGLVATQRDYLVTSNRESGLGRYDVVMEPESRAGRKAVIMEFKVFDPKKEKSLDDTAARALKQIGEKRYDADLLKRGFQKADILYYGIAFRGKEALVKKMQTHR